jgi:signal transduction histidine kinase
MITDNGVGFDPQAARSCGGLGLLSMEERIRLVGGTLAISSSPGQGTRVEARVPWPKAAG